MPRKRSIVSDAVKYEIAQELGFADKINVQNGSYDFGDITTRQAGSIVSGLIRKAEEYMAAKNAGQGR